MRAKAVRKGAICARTHLIISHSPLCRSLKTSQWGDGDDDDEKYENDEDDDEGDGPENNDDDDGDDDEDDDEDDDDTFVGESLTKNASRGRKKK